MIYIILTVAGVYWLHREIFGNMSFFPLAVFLVLYNRILLWGFINYLMGTALMVIGLALWVYLKDSRTPQRILTSSLMALAIYYAHLFPFVLYLICIAVFELQTFLEKKPRRWSGLWSSILAASPQLLAPVTLFLFFSPTVESAGRIAFGDLIRKFTNAPMLPFNNYVPALDAVTLLGTICFYVAGVALGFLQLSRSMWGVICALSLVHFLTPQLLMSSPNADVRTIIPLVLVMIASTRFTEKSRRFITVSLVLMSILFLIRTAVIVKNWHWADQTIYNEYQQIFKQLPRGAKVANMFVNSGTGWFTNPPHAHYVTLAIIEKSAFVPKLFTFSTQQPVAFKGKYNALGMSAPSGEFYYPDPAQPLIPDPADQHNPFYKPGFHGMEYLLLANYRDVRGSMPEFLDLVEVTDSLALYRIKNGGSDSGGILACQP